MKSAQEHDSAVAPQQSLCLNGYRHENRQDTQTNDLRTTFAGKKRRMANLRQSAAHPQQQQGSGCATHRLRAMLQIQAVPAHALTQTYLPASRVLSRLTLRFAPLCMQKPRQHATPGDLLSRSIIPFGDSRGCQAPSGCITCNYVKLSTAGYAAEAVYIIRVMQATIGRATASLAAGLFPLRNITPP